jgi:vacuolar-type H+-ATPase subunit F/Vma7
MTMAKIVAIGNRSFAVALAGIGAEPVRSETAEEFVAALRKVALQKDVHLVFAPEELLQAKSDAVDAFRARSSAALLGLPLKASDKHPSFDEMRYLVEQATGASLI